MYISIWNRCSWADTTRTLSVLSGSDVTLGCLFEKLSRFVHWSAFTVEWNVADRRAAKRTVYTLEDGSAHVSREGCQVDRLELQRSNASLQLRNVTVGDQGLYTCRVITPVVHTEATLLEVLGTPVSLSLSILFYSILSSNLLLIYLGERGSKFTCRYHYKNSQVDYTHKDKKKSQLQVL
uniref:Ig-like domain-containing protein n=1 Tax=Myripristis murdjan TaxID=586833 RepID=A0A667XT57_9TELE